MDKETKDYIDAKFKELGDRLKKLEAEVNARAKIGHKHHPIPPLGGRRF